MKEIIFIASNKGKQKSTQKHFDDSKITIKICEFEMEKTQINDI